MNKYLVLIIFTKAWIAVVVYMPIQTVLNLSFVKHTRLLPWCPWCPWCRGDDPDHSFDPDPTPKNKIKL